MPLITVAHSPDSDDAFMHYALARHKIDTGDIEFRHVLEDIQSLNVRASQGDYEVTAISIHAYAYLADKYALLPHGASMGERYGPMIVAREAFSLDQITRQTVAVPGIQTSAYLALKLFAPNIKTQVMPFDEILPAVVRGDVAAGLLIHEGQLTYGDEGLHNIIDLGVWWAQETGGLPLPLGGNAIRRDLEPELARRVSHYLRESIRYALEHRDEALDYAMEYARGLEDTRDRADTFVGMYVNSRTLDYGDDGRRSVQLFLDRGFEAGIIPHRVEVRFAD
ncbi:MAG TPA: MqnA/MqnD/SBP family protein [Abditibacteriaceae bacterium]|jgi:1,4-dihydroxy-6-naphthoate synthase